MFRWIRWGACRSTQPVAAMVASSDAKSTTTDTMTSTKVTHFWCRNARFCTRKTMLSADSSAE